MLLFIFGFVWYGNLVSLVDLFGVDRGIGYGHFKACSTQQQLQNSLVKLSAELFSQLFKVKLNQKKLQKWK